MSDKPLKDQRKENQQSANDKVKQVVTALKLTSEERRILHDSITGNDYMSYQDILAAAKTLFGK